MRFLDDRSARSTTRYGGGFVQSIDGIEGERRSAARNDWFFYVNGIESPVGAGRGARVRGATGSGGTTATGPSAMRVAGRGRLVARAVRSGSAGEPDPVRVVLPRVASACATAVERLADAGVDGAGRPGSRRPARPAGRRDCGCSSAPGRGSATDPAVDAARGGPARSGVFATFERPPRGLAAVGARLSRRVRAERLAPAPGSSRRCGAASEQQTWVVTGPDQAAVARRATALERGPLRDRYAVARDRAARTRRAPDRAGGGGVVRLAHRIRAAAGAARPGGRASAASAYFGVAGGRRVRLLEPDRARRGGRRRRRRRSRRKGRAGAARVAAMGARAGRPDRRGQRARVAARRHGPGERATRCRCSAAST